MFIKILPSTKNDLLNLQEILKDKIKSEVVISKENLEKVQQINLEKILENFEEFKKENVSLKQQIEKTKSEVVISKENLEKTQQINLEKILENFGELKKENIFYKQQIEKISKDYNKKILKLNEEIHNVTNLMNKVMLAELIKNHKDSLNKVLTKK